MSTQTAQRSRAVAAVLESARARVAGKDVSYTGGVDPAEAWALFHSGQALLVDVRTAAERKFVGHIPGAAHAEWESGLDLQLNPNFIRDLEHVAHRDDVILLLCRSGRRSAAAAEAARAAGFAHVYNVDEGFEGALDARLQRGHRNGWRVLGLPWAQD